MTCSYVGEHSDFDFSLNYLEAGLPFEGLEGAVPAKQSPTIEEPDHEFSKNAAFVIDADIFLRKQLDAKLRANNDLRQGISTDDTLRALGVCRF